MASIQHILFPFDFSQQGLLAARFVRTVAERFSARITLLGVVPPVWDVPAPVGMPPLAAVDTEKREHGMKTRLDAALPQELAGLSLDRVTEHGDPALKIAEFADAHAVDLIMMPTHGLGLFRRLLLGSVTAKVLHDTKCPVWTATHAEEQRSKDLPKTIVCVVDGAPKTASLAQWAAEYSRHMGATLRLLHVVAPLSDWLALPSERELQEQAREEGRARIEAQLRSVGLAELPLRVAVGPIADTVTEEARQEGADLLIVARGAHSHGIIPQSPCPVVSV